MPVAQIRITVSEVTQARILRRNADGEFAEAGFTVAQYVSRGEKKEKAEI
jgi:hypothetical protein